MYIQRERERERDGVQLKMNAYMEASKPNTYNQLIECNDII